MKKAIINYINARAEKIKPCKHNWKEINNGMYGNLLNKQYTWKEIDYFCNKCGKHKHIECK